ncbi:MAG: Hsp33 family molecular chaperone HslO, partial [Candidatus Eremiobacteraeota bacterium]|nr:Hsp33 family molecular chaperone HslO [Candidatus Eremiobacteraeota bacterium]
AVGSGSLQVTRSSDVGQPYAGVVPLHSGEIGEDLALYLAQSEQIPSVVAVGVLANPKGIVAAGGLFARVLPGSDERTRSELESRAAALPPVTTSIARGASAEALMRGLAGDWELGAMESKSVKFACRCSREKVEAVLLGLGADELLELTRRPDGTEALCEYCKQRYAFTPPQVAELRARL